MIIIQKTERKFVFIFSLLSLSKMDQPTTLWLRFLTLVKWVPGSLPGKAQNFVFITACSIPASDFWSGVVVDKDLAVSSDQGNV